ncbi:EamA family transporter [Granulicella sp. S190]|uniref:EamA family transporter n=1 Tax=Granulicella sp. S190 TaxID=1747226 RepID=UPI0020B161D7|nr:EamA family transporter [Granulicella sp. S190]
MLLHGNALLALAAAVVWGGGDFSGGMGVKHAGGSMGAALRVILLSHCMSLSVLTVTAWLSGDTFPHGAALAYGLVAGMTAGISLACFYIALSRGAMGASAALSGLLAAAIPAVFSVVWEGSPGVLRLCGFVVAGAAIWLIAAGENAEAKAADRSTFWLAVVGGVGFGVYFTALKLAAAKTGVIWPLATCRMGSIAVCSLLLAGLSLRTKTGEVRAKVTRRVVVWAVATALLDTSGNMLYIAATRAGRLDVAAVLASLYPATTILLAAWTLRERPTRRQGLGMAVAVAAVVMITV